MLSINRGDIDKFPSVKVIVRESIRKCSRGPNCPVRSQEKGQSYVILGMYQIADGCNVSFEIKTKPESGSIDQGQPKLCGLRQDVFLSVAMAI